MKVHKLHKFKIVFIGDMNVGKTSIISRYTREDFSITNIPTIGIDFVSKSIQLDNMTVRLQLWDTAGQERFRSLIPSYIRDSHVIILVYDVSNEQTFHNLNKWLDYVKSQRDSDVIMYLLGNKYDSENKQVTYEMAKEFKEKNKIINEFKEVSALTNYQITECFKEITQLLLDPYQQSDNFQNLGIDKYNHIELKNQEKKTKSNIKSKCC